MRERMIRHRTFLLMRPQPQAGEPWPPEAHLERLLTGAKYDLPETEKLTLSGPRPEQGFCLVLPADEDIRAGDLLKPAGDPAKRYAVTEVRRYPGHVEATARRIPDEEETE